MASEKVPIKMTPHTHAQLSRHSHIEANRRHPRRTAQTPTHAHGGQASETASSIISFTHTQTSSLTLHKDNIRLENTYRLEPDSDKQFSVKQVSDAVHSVLESYLGDVTYDAARCSQLSRDLSSLIKSRVKEMCFPRYKLVCLVSIGENAGQTVNIASRAVWNTDTDTYANVTYKNANLYAVATVYGLYFD